MLVKRGLALVDDYQPRPGLKSHRGHIRRRVNHQAGADHDKKVALLRMLVRVSQVFARAGTARS